MIIKILEFLIDYEIILGGGGGFNNCMDSSLLCLSVFGNILQSLSFASVLESICNYSSYSSGEILTLPCSCGLYQQWPQFYIWYFSGQPQDPSWALTPGYIQQSYLLQCHLINTLQQIPRCTRRSCFSVSSDSLWHGKRDPLAPTPLSRPSQVTFPFSFVKNTRRPERLRRILTFSS